MTISRANGVPVYYEVYGTGTPVLMITGMASVMEWFRYNIPAFVDAGYQVIAQDLRGSRRADISIPASGYSTLDMARDSLGILDDLEIERAHIFGMSMGGLVAQVLGVCFSSRVNRLIIAANGLARMPEALRKVVLGQADDGSAVAEMHRHKESAEERLASSISLAFTPQFGTRHPDRLAFFRDVIAGAHEPPETTRVAQTLAACKHDYLDHLSRIDAPTLLLVGELDTVNGGQIDQMAKRISQNRCHILPDMAHGMVLEHADEINELALRFLAEDTLVERQPGDTEAPSH